MNGATTYVKRPAWYWKLISCASLRYQNASMLGLGVHTTDLSTYWVLSTRFEGTEVAKEVGSQRSLRDVAETAGGQGSAQSGV